MDIIVNKSSEHSIAPEALVFLSCFKIIEYALKIKARLDPLFSEIFIDPINNWDKIKQVFEPFGTSSIVSNASFSKDIDASDGIKTIWIIRKSQGILVQCYNTAKKLGILNDATASLITITINPNSQEQTNFKKWEVLITQYEEIKQLQISQLLTAYAMSAFYLDELTEYGGATRTAGQLLLYNSYLEKISMYLPYQVFKVAPYTPLSNEVLYKAPFDAVRGIFPDLLNIFTNDWWDKLMFLDTIDIEYEDILIHYTITLSDISQGYFLFPFDPYVVRLVYMIGLPSDDPDDVPIALKLCYGLEYGDSKTWDCTTCEYANQCKNSDFVSPLLHDSVVQNKVSLLASGLIANNVVRIKYKRAII